MRRDIAAFLLRVRAENAALADQLGWQLQAVPTAWCALVLPNRTPAQLDQQFTEANTRGRTLARILHVGWRPPVAAPKQRLLRFARDEAARRFCPAQAQTPGHPATGKAAPAVRFSSKGNITVQDTALPDYYASNQLMPTIRDSDLRVAYVELLVGMPDMSRSLPWPIGFDCGDSLDHAEWVQRTDKPSEYADRLRESLPSRHELEVAAADRAREAFTVLESRAICSARQVR